MLFLALWTAHRFRVRHLQKQEKKFRGNGGVDSGGGVRDGVPMAVVHSGTAAGTVPVEQALLTDGSRGTSGPTRVLDKWRTAVATAEPLDYEARARGSDGVYRWFQVRATPLRDHGGKVTKWCGVATDIEDRKRADELQSELAHIDRVTMLGEMAAAISHELKQPLTASLINAQTSLRWLRREQPGVHEASGDREDRVDGTRATDIIDRLRALYTKPHHPRNGERRGCPRNDRLARR
jgi:signal transduction histidine kinase